MEQHPDESPRSEEGHAQPPACCETGQWPPEQHEESAQAGRPAALPTGSTGSGRPDPDPADPFEPAERKRIGFIEGHLPDIVDPLDPKEPDTVFSETRRLRHDGWNPDRMRRFLERYAECGVLREACEAAGMSAKSVYNLRDRDPLFAAGCEAAIVKARAPLADEVYSRSRNGVVERIYKDGVIVAERHKYDNRLTMATLNRLDARIDLAEKNGAAHLKLVANWEDYLDALGEGRPADAQALLAEPVLSAAEGPAPVPAADLQENAKQRELRELHLGGPLEIRDRHQGVWEDEEGLWTDYPPPEDFDGDEEGEYGDDDYRRTLCPEEQAVIDAEEEADAAEDRARAEAQRRAFFGFDPEPPPEGESGPATPDDPEAPDGSG